MTNETPTEPTDKNPNLFEFLQSVLWPDSDGGNVVALLCRASWFDRSPRPLKVASELRQLAEDREYDEAAISALFNRESYHPYVVVFPKNARDFCTSMAETVEFVAGITSKNAK